MNRRNKLFPHFQVSLRKRELTKAELYVILVGLLAIDQKFARKIMSKPEWSRLIRENKGKQE